VTPDAALAEAKAGKLRPVYVVAGEERLLRERVVAELRAAALGNGVAAFNEDKFTAGETSIDAVLSAVRTVPMMAPKRFVLLRSAERWEAGEGDDAAKTSPLDDLAEYVKQPIDSTCLVVSATKLDGRRKLATTSKKLGVLVACDPLSERELPGWIMEHAKQRGHAISRDTAEHLAQIAGPELAYVDDCLERLSLYVGKGNKIDDDAVRTAITRVRAQDAWAVASAIGRRDMSGALSALADAYDPRDRGLPLLGALAWSIRQLARYKAAVDDGESHDEAARRAGAFGPQRAYELRDRAREVKPGELERWLTVLAEADLALKGSKRAPEAVLEGMVTQLCRR
jgi:DNA polymerase-3 subunit delta